MSCNLRVLLLLTTLLCSMPLPAQDDLAVIKDFDGFVNVHSADAQSKVVGRILPYQLFSCIAEIDAGYPNMECVYHQSYSAQEGGYLRNSRNDTFSRPGYIHQSRVQKLSQLPQLKQTSLLENSATYANSSISVTISIAPFDLKKHVMRNSEGQQVTKINQIGAGWHTIDGSEMWGTDGNIPHTEIRAITVTQGEKTLHLPAHAIKNIFQPNIDAEYTSVCVGADGELYIQMLNSNGPSSYNVVWVVGNGELVCMYIGSSWYT